MERRALRPVLACLLCALGSGGCATYGAVRALRAEVAQLRREIRQAEHGAAAAAAQVQELDLKTEVHTYLQRDPLLAGRGHLAALEQRISRATRSYTFLLPSDLGGGAARALYFPPGVFLRIDFLSGVLPTDAANQLEVSARSDCFRPVGVEERPDRTYLVNEESGLLVETLPGDGAAVLTELLFRFLPARGPGSLHHAYVRVTLAAPPAQVQVDPPTKLPKVRRVRWGASPTTTPSAPAIPPSLPAASSPPPTVDDPPGAAGSDAEAEREETFTIDPIDGAGLEELLQ